MKFLLLVLPLVLSSSLSNYEPQQIHIAVGEKNGDFTFTWSTRSKATTPQVILSDGTSAAATSTLFTSGDNTWYIYKTAVSGLTQGKQYSYQVGDKTLGLSSSYKFNVSVEQAATSHVIIGDISTSSQYGLPTWQAINAFLPSNPATTILHVGDIAYDLCTNNNTNGDEFMQMIQSQAASIPYMALPGNHEYTDLFVNYIQRFNFAGNTQNFYYTFASGFARFVVFTTEFWFQEDQSLLQPQLTWLQSTLARSANDIAKYPWLIVLTHRPLYCIQKPKNPDCNEDAVLLQGALEKLIYDSNVDLYINGHVHNYQRTSPIHKGQPKNYNNGSTFVNPGAPIYVTNGGSGCDEGNKKVHVKDSTPWFITGTQLFSFSNLLVHNATHLEYQQYTVSPTTLFDNFWVVKDSQEVD